MEVRLTTPVGDRARELRLGDVAYISGIIITARDAAHRLMLDQNLGDLGLRDGVLYHCGPLVKDRQILSAGPTTSIRMEPYSPFVIEEKGVKLIIGKGGMGDGTSLSLEKNGGAYLSFLGGGGALAAENLEVEDVMFMDRLGMAEAMWILRADKFGPLTVTMDSSGGSIYRNVNRDVMARMEELVKLL